MWWAYIKPLQSGVGIHDFDDQHPFNYVRADHCGDTNKVHLSYSIRTCQQRVGRKHVASPPHARTDKDSHLYTLVVRPDNTFDILIDPESKAGSFSRI